MPVSISQSKLGWFDRVLPRAFDAIATDLQSCTIAAPSLFRELSTSSHVGFIELKSLWFDISEMVNFSKAVYVVFRHLK